LTGATQFDTIPYGDGFADVIINTDTHVNTQSDGDAHANGNHDVH
jgi:hypothetical protein